MTERNCHTCHHVSILKFKFKPEPFTINPISIDKATWSYQDKFGDVSIYFCKSDLPNVQQFLFQPNTQPNRASLPTFDLSPGVSLGNSSSSSGLPNQAPATPVGGVGASAAATSTPTSTTMLTPLRFENFNNKLKLWKCCTLVKKQSLTLDKILSRIKTERFLKIRI